MIISIKEVRNFIISILIPLIVGYLSNVLSRLLSGISTSTYYSQLIKPSFAPPSFIFPIVWTILYVLMGISSYGIFSSKSDYIGVSFWVYALQLALNFFWPIIFFKSQLYTFAFVWILLLICAVALMITMFSKVNKISAYLMIPYLVWCIYAAYLNLGVVVLN